MSRRRPTILLSLLILAIMAGRVAAQDPPPAETPPATPPTEELAQKPVVDAEAIDARIAELQQLNQEEEAVKSELDLLNRAMTSLQEYESDLLKTTEFQDKAKTAPERLATIQEALQVPIEEDLPEIVEASTLDELNGLLQSAQNQSNAAKSLRDDIVEEVTTRNTRLAAIPDLIAQTTSTLQQVTEALQAATNRNDTSPLGVARQLSLSAQKLALETKLSRLSEETRSYNIRGEVMQARVDMAQRQVTIAERVVQQYQTRVDRLRAEEADRTRREAAAALRAAAGAHPLVRTVTEERANLADENVELSDFIATTTAQREEITNLITKWQTAFDSNREQEKTIGFNEVLGLRLRSQQLQLPDESALKSKMKQIKEDLLSVHAMFFELSALRTIDRSPELKAAELDRLIRESADPIPAGQEDSVLDALKEAVDARGQVRIALLTNYEEYQKDLTTLHQSTRKLSELVAGYNDYINIHVLWIRSAAVVNLGDVKRTGAAIAYFLNVKTWSAFVGAAYQDFRQNIPLYGAATFLLVILFAGRGRLRKAIRESGEGVARVTTDRFALTVRAMLLSIMLVLTLPALIWFLTWRAQRTPVIDDIVAATGSALQRIALMVLILEMIRELSRAGGMADLHFRWKQKNLELVRSQLKWFLPLIVPLGIMSIFVNAVAVDEHRDSLGRLLFILCMPLISLFAWRVLHPSKGIPASWLALHPTSWSGRLRMIWFPLLVFAPMGFIVMSLLGYPFTAIMLQRQLDDTVGLLLLVFICYHLLLRWLTVTQRRLAVEQARKKRAAALAAARAEAEERAKQEDGGGDVTSLEPPAALDDSEIDVASISAQTSNLLRNMLGLSALLILIGAWADVLPAFGMLREVPLGDMMTTQFINGAETPVPVSLADLATAIIILLFTFGINRNLSGMLEMIVLRRISISAGAKYAVVTMSRYVLIIVGVVLAFDQVGIGWAQVQWLAAAITVGLGFGLQEIFANFVSGIILLFERPIRIGDTVTVGDTSGTVTRIHMRATTITDWDRKELIIPNKAFITGQIINWTLSEAILRVRIPVGIAYGSDTETARRLLLQCAAENERVLEDPAPLAIFCSFGDSSLDFELRVFIPHIDHLVSVKHELHNAIDQAFREANIEIAFPQRDLHVRSITPALEVVGDRRVMDAETVAGETLDPSH